MKNLEETLNKYTMIIITGGSSGIGSKFINYVVKLTDGVLICNISRSKPEEFLANERLRHYPCDLGKLEELEATLGDLETFVKSVPAGPILLINNSGFGSYGRFAELEVQHELNMIDVNVRAVVQITHRFLPYLKERGGDVINVASTAAWQPTPYLSTYGATKAFLMHWGLSLNEELRKDGVRVLTLCPGPTESAFFKRAGFETAPVSGIGETAAQVVESALVALGKRRSLVVSGWKNKLLVAIASKLPRVLQARLSRIVLEKMRLEQFNTKSK